MRTPMSLFLALLAVFQLAPAPAIAQLRLGPGIGFASFVGGGGRLSPIDGLAASLKLEIPLNERDTGEKDASGKSLTEYSQSLYLGVPIVADQNTLLSSFDVQFASQLGRSGLWGLAGLQVAFASAELLAKLDTRDPVPLGDEIQTAIFLGPKIGFYGEVPVEDRAIPIEVQASLDWHLAGIPDGLEHPKILRFDVIVPNDLLK